MTQGDIVLLAMDTYKTKAFARWADKEKLRDATLCDAIGDVIDGLIDADLGGGLIKVECDDKAKA